MNTNNRHWKNTLRLVNTRIYVVILVFTETGAVRIRQMVKRRAFARTVPDCVMSSFLNPKMIRVVALVCMTQVYYFSGCVWVELQNCFAISQSRRVSGNVNVMVKSLSFAVGWGSVRITDFDLVVPTMAFVRLRNNPATKLELVRITRSGSLPSDSKRSGWDST